MNKMKYILYPLSMCVAAYLLPNIAIAQEKGFTLEEVPEKKPAPVYYSEWEAGIIYSSEDSFKFGEYTGLEEEGFRPNVNFLVRKISAYDDDSTEFAEVIGTNLGLDSRSLFGKYGRQGKYSVYFDYDQLPHFQFDDAKSLFVGAGTSFQTTPVGWDTQNFTTNLAADPDNAGLFPSSNQVDVKTERTTVGGGFSWIPAKHWQITGDYHHQKKDGTEQMVAIFGDGGSSGRTRASTLITPVDYNFDGFDIGIAYADRKAQFDLRYNLSLFRNDNKSVIWQNPFCGSDPACTRNAVMDGAFGQFSLPPDNRYHQVTLTGGYNLGLTSRVSGKFSYGQMLQDDTFLPYTINPRVTVTAPLPRPDLDGEIGRIHANVNFTTRPWKGLDLGARYTFDDWDNNTPRDIFFRVFADTDNQDPDTTNPINNINYNYSLRKHKVELDAGYRITGQTKLSASYDYDWNQRDYSEVAITREHTGKVKLSGSPFSMASGWIEYARSDREGSNYVSNQPFISAVHPDYIAATPGCSAYPFIDCRFNDPLLRKYHMADREQDRIAAALTISPANQVTFGLTGSYTNVDFDETIVGLTGLKTYSATVDAGYTPRENIETYAYYTYEFFDREQAGSNILRVVPLVPPALDWLQDTEDRVNSIGAGIKWSKIKGKYDLTADYVFSKAITEIDPTNLSPTTPAIPFPDLVTGIHSFSLRADYNLKDNVIMRFNYLFERFKSKDWALDGVAQNTIQEVITLGNSSPDYNVHAFGLSAIYKF